jgi:hypothetical protein
MPQAAAEDITLTTYYPSPRGVYQQLRVGSPDAAAPIGMLQVTKPDPDDGTFAFRVDDQTADPSPFVVTENGQVLIGVTVPPATNPKVYVIGRVEGEGFHGYEDTGVYAFVESGGSPGDGWAQLGGWNVAFSAPAPTFFDGAPLALQTRPGAGNRNVGIGLPLAEAATPQNRLDVEGSVAIGAAYAGAATAPANSLIVQDSLGIGMTAPVNRLDIGGGGGAAIGTTYAGTAAPTNGLIVEGDVGIGVTAPVVTLDVNGPVKVGGTLAEVCDATKAGTIRWIITALGDPELQYCDGADWQTILSRQSSCSPVGAVSTFEYRNCAHPCVGSLVWTGTQTCTCDIYGVWSGCSTACGTPPIPAPSPCIPP